MPKPPARRTIPKHQLRCRVQETAVCINELSAEQAYATGSAVGSLLQQGIPIEDAITTTRAIAEFIKRGQRAQTTVNQIIADHAAALDT